MSRGVWLEVALNGPWGQRLQPGIPVTAAEIVDQALACIDTGATIVHFHAYDPDTGRQRDTYELYAPIIERIRNARPQAIVYPTIPIAGGPDAREPLTGAQRYEAVEKLADAGLLEWAVVDPGSVNLAGYRELRHGKFGFTYANPPDHVLYGLKLCARSRLVPSYAIYEPGFMRYGAAMRLAVPGAPQPVYRLMFSDEMAFGLPPEEYALEAYLTLLAQEASGAAWMVAGLGVDIAPLVGPAVREGGHVRVGLEDAPLACTKSNAALVQEAVVEIEAAGGYLASGDDVRLDTVR